MAISYYTILRFPTLLQNYTPRPALTPFLYPPPPPFVKKLPKLHHQNKFFTFLTFTNI